MEADVAVATRLLCADEEEMVFHISLLSPPAEEAALTKAPAGVHLDDTGGM